MLHNAAVLTLYGIASAIDGFAAAGRAWHGSLT
jgi:hypothetical protein